MLQSFPSLYSPLRNVFIIVITFLLLNGCSGIPISAHTIEKFIDKKDSESLLGLPKEMVYERFGEPDWVLDMPSRNYLIYSAAGEVDRVWEALMPFLVLPSKAYSNDPLEALYCAVFEIDEAGKVTDFNLDWTRSYTSQAYGDLQTCMRLIPKDILQAEQTRLRHLVATEGDMKAFNKLEKFFKDSDVLLYKREYFRKRLKEGDNSSEVKMELAYLGEFDPFGILSGVYKGQSDAVELDLCAEGKIVSIKLENSHNEPIYYSLSRKEILCNLTLRAGRYFLTYHTDLLHDATDECNRDSVSGIISLEAGHKYMAKTFVCRMFCCHYKCMSSATTWVEDLNTGKIVFGSSKKCP